jgi:hypothetical protein
MHAIDKAVGPIDRAAGCIEQRPYLVAASFVFLPVSIARMGMVRHMHIRPAFYSTVAALIPVLLLVAVVHAGYFQESKQTDRSDRHIARWMLSMPLGGEIAALICVARGNDTALLRALVLIALGAVGLLLWFYALYGPARTQLQTGQDLLAAADKIRAASKVAD